MPWLVSAFAMLAAAGMGLVRRAGVQRALVPAAAGVGGALGIEALTGILPSPDGDRPRRRRRRRALTASDRADIAFIAGLLGPTAGRNFAITIATRA